MIRILVGEGKGTDKAFVRFQRFFWKESRNNTRTVWVLKCDMRKFFASINHDILMNILSRHMKDTDTLSLLKNIIESFHSTKDGV